MKKLEDYILIKNMKVLPCRNNFERKGTDYFEFYPGLPDGKWYHDDSIYIQEDYFEDMFDCIQKVIPEFDYYDVNVIERMDWYKIIRQIKHDLKKDYSKYHYFIYWIKERLKTNKYITIFGL